MSKINRLTNPKSRKMIEEGLIEYICNVKLEGDGYIENIRDCEKLTVSETPQEVLSSAKYYRIGSYYNLERTKLENGVWIKQPTHHISVIFYKDIKHQTNEPTRN